MGLVMTKEQTLRDTGLNPSRGLVGAVGRILDRPSIALELDISDCATLALRLNLLSLSNPIARLPLKSFSALLSCTTYVSPIFAPLYIAYFSFSYSLAWV